MSDNCLALEGSGLVLRRPDTETEVRQALLALRLHLGLHMSSLHPGVTGRKSNRQESRLPPILVSVRQARELLADMSKDKFWEEAKRGAFGELVGNKQKRYLFFVNLERYARGLPLAPYSKRTPGYADTAAVRRKAARQAARNKTTGTVGKGAAEAVT